MKKKDNSQKTQLKNRIKIAHRKARNVGGWYFFATLILTVLTFLPLVTWRFTQIVDGVEKVHDIRLGVLGLLDYGTLWTNALYETNAAGGRVLSLTPERLRFFVVCTMYYIFQIGMLINLIKSLKQGKILRQKTWKKSEGADVINGKAEAMQMRSKYFSRAFAAMVNIHLLIALFVPVASGYFTISLFGYIALGVGVFFHFCCRIGAAKVSVFVYDEEEAANYNPFQPRRNVCYIQEVKRERGLFRPFIANLLQMITCAALIFLFAKFSVIDGYVTTAIAAIKANNFPALINIKALMQCGLLIFVCILVSHTTSAVEYNIDWIDGKGMKKFGVLLLLSVLLSVGILVVGYIGNIGGVFALIKGNVAIDVLMLSRLDLSTAMYAGNLAEIHKVLATNDVKASIQELQQTLALILAIVAGFLFFLLNAVTHKRKRERIEAEEEDVLDADDMDLNLEGYINTYAFPAMPAMYAQPHLPQKAAMENSGKKKKK